jgi:hypothetical protein
MSKVTVAATRVTPRLRLNLVAAVDFGVGESVLQCSEQEIQETRTWRTVQVGVDRHLKNEFLAYADHSCEPNALFDIETLSLNAIREIKTGDLVRFFYPGSEVELAQTFRCNCGAAACLGQIKGGFYLTPEQMRWAIDQGFCTSFMKSELLRLLGDSG